MIQRALRLILSGLLLFLSAPGPGLQAQSFDADFIRRWLTLGPIVEGETAPGAINIDYLLAATGFPESNFATLEGAPKPGDLVVFKPKGYLAQPRSWQVMELPENHDLDSMLIQEGSVDFAVAYLLTFIESKEASRRELRLGSDDALKVWLNGEVAHTAALDRGLRPDQDTVSVTLKKGMNCLLLKVADGVVAWQLTARFKDASGLQFFDSPTGQILPLGQPIPQLSSSQLEAPTAEPGQGTEGVWRTYQYVDGLADNWINAIMQHRDGSIWFGTTNGLSRFDGKNWKTYAQKEGLADNRVHSLIQDTEGKIWVGTENGVSVLDEAKKSWKTYTPKDGLAHPKVLKILQDQAGNFWFATGGGGISRFDEKSSTWSTYTQKDGLAGNVVQCLSQDRQGSIWLGTWGDGVSRFDLKTKSWKTYTQKDGLADNRVNDILADQAGVIWFATENGASRFDLKTETWKAYTKDQGLSDSRVLDIMQDKEGRLWFATWNKGVSCLELKADGGDGRESWKTYTQKDGLVKNLVQVMLQDREGAFWFGTWYNGVSRFEERNWKVYTQKDGLANNAVYKIIEDPKDPEGVFWFATKNGLSRFKLKTNSWKTYTQKDGLADNAFFEIIKDRQGRLWFGAYSGISRFDGKLWKNYLDPELDEKWVHCILEDKEGKIWFGTESAGALCFDGQTESWKTYTQKEGLAHDAVYDIMQDKDGRLWFATNGGGVSQFDAKSKNWKAFTQKDGLAHNSVRVIMQDNKDQGTVWFGTRGGISRFDGKNWKSYTQKEGLANDQVFSMLQDEDGIIWIGTDNGGVSKFDGRCFQTLDSKDGLPNDYVVCIYLDKNAQVWFGTEGGVVRYIPEKTPPPIYITRVSSSPAELHENPENGIALKAGGSRLVLSYHAISFKTRPENIKYFYQLTGPVETTRRVVSTFTADNWQGPTNSETVEYLKLKPGRYRFKVQAVDRDLNYSNITSLEFTLPPLWHQLGWVRGLIAGGGLAFLLAFGLVLWRWSASRIATRSLEQQLREQEARERLALQESEHRFRTIANTAIDGIISTNSRGEIIFFNQGAVKQFGYSQDEVIGKLIQMLMPERHQASEDSENEKWLGFLATDEAPGKTVELNGLRKDGGEFPIEVSFTTWNSGNDIYFTSIVRDITERKRAEEALSHQAQLQILRYQLNPHFLFNALNTIRALIGENPNTAEMIVSEFSEYLRYSLLNKNWLDVSLGDEIEAIRNFLAIEKIRFEDQLDISIEVEPAAEKYRVPGFFIQPLVENAIKYGMQTSPMPLKVKIAAYVSEGLLHIEVWNTGSWEKPSEAQVQSNETNENATDNRPQTTKTGTGTGVGIQNVKERLAHMFPNRHQFEIFERDGWVQVMIKIRLQKLGGR